MRDLYTSSTPTQIATLSAQIIGGKRLVRRISASMTSSCAELRVLSLQTGDRVGSFGRPSYLFSDSRGACSGACGEEDRAQHLDYGLRDLLEVHLPGVQRLLIRKRRIGCLGVMSRRAGLGADFSCWSYQHHHPVACCILQG